MQHWTDRDAPFLIIGVKVVEDLKILDAERGQLAGCLASLDPSSPSINASADNVIGEGRAQWSGPLGVLSPPSGAPVVLLRLGAMLAEW